MSVHYVLNFDEWKQAFLRLQSQTDMIIHSGMLKGMSDWDFDAAERYVLANCRVPVGTVAGPMMGNSLLGLVKVPDEQGEWAALTALSIMDGKKPHEIPVTRNKKGEIYINLDIAEKLDINFDHMILKNARVYKKGE